jgi:hypothetical protein
LFGPTSPARWAPIGKKHLVLTGGSCGCDGNLFACAHQKHCLAEISPEQIFAVLQKTLPPL